MVVFSKSGGKGEAGDVKIAQHMEYLMHGIRYLWLDSKSEMGAAENQVTSEAEMVDRRVQILESQSVDETPLRLQVQDWNRL